MRGSSRQQAHSLASSNGELVTRDTNSKTIGPPSGAAKWAHRDIDAAERPRAQLLRLCCAFGDRRASPNARNVGAIPGPAGCQKYQRQQRLRRGGGRSQRRTRLWCRVRRVPVKQGKYREISQEETYSSQLGPGNRLESLPVLIKIPTQRKREFQTRIRELIGDSVYV